MLQAVGVRFERAGKVYHFSSGGLNLREGDWVVVDTAQGLSLGWVVLCLTDADTQRPDGDLKPVLRLADSHDLLLRSYYQSREQRALERCRERVAERGLDMNVVRARYSFNGARVSFYFTADHRVDFRSLVRDLARVFRTHVELRQLGPRDELKLQGGRGPCGRPLCCATWLSDFKPISIRMAKAQDVPLNPENISGSCGRLRCCFSYEYDLYVQGRRRVPDEV
jgi:cell fate regulator YaaT (PSP1 superfamily)